MTITIAPADEACQAIVDRINTGSGLTYTLPSAAEYFYNIDDSIERLSDLKVDVIHVEERDANSTLDTVTRTSHGINVFVRKKIAGAVTTADIAAVKLIARQICVRLMNHGTSRIRVWEVELDSEEGPDRSVLRQDGVISLMISLRVVVEPAS